MFFSIVVKFKTNVNNWGKVILILNYFPLVRFWVQILRKIIKFPILSFDCFEIENQRSWDIKMITLQKYFTYAFFCTSRVRIPILIFKFFFIFWMIILEEHRHLTYCNRFQYKTMLNWTNLKNRLYFQPLARL